MDHAELAIAAVAEAYPESQTKSCFYAHARGILLQPEVYL